RVLSAQCEFSFWVALKLKTEGGQLTPSMKRELAAAAAIPIVLAILFLAPPLAFNLLVAAVALAALWEFYRLAEKTGHPVAKTIGMLSGAWILLAAAWIFGGDVVMSSSSTSLVILQPPEFSTARFRGLLLFL